MPDHALSLLLDVLSTFRAPLRARAFANLLVLAAGWVLTQGPVHCVTEALVAADVARRRHWSAFHRFFSRGRWTPDVLGLFLFRRLERHLPPGVLALVLDDTLCPKKGPEVFGLGNHLDPVRSTRRHKAFAFGHCWVVLAVLVRVPFSERVWALPVLFRLYRTKKEAGTAYAKKTELGRQMLAVVLGWTERAGTRLWLSADLSYANAAVFGGLPERLTVVGAMRPDAALYAPPPEASGPRRTKGARLASPAELAADGARPWQRARARLYGATERVAFKTYVALWPTVTGRRPVRVVVARCARGALPCRAFFCTDADLAPAALLERYAARWSIEVWFRDAKQLFGLGEAPVRRRAAVERVAPWAGLLSSALVVWFVEAHRLGVAALPVRPWYGQKAGHSFADVLRAARRTLAGVDVLALAERARTFAPPARAWPQGLALPYAA